ncbi:urease accessory protein UreF [Marinivivus vitaminiproducens]|uniref:urease accessory protein UreF n=1 Tax=Marinivivus vitaminiproducens TaxID=3035935 RepID=UPI0027A82F3D|nr:urease accessory protein UreF [Geminicoccaceae bacterium SCSIO 64248]
MSGTIERPALPYKLLVWLSPGFPVGAFSYAHGLEQAVDDGRAHDAASVQRYVTSALRHGAGAIDGALLAGAWRASCEGDAARVADLVELAAAWRGSAELALESGAQGRAFLSTVRAAWPHADLDRLAEVARSLGVLPAYPVAVGVACAAHGVALLPALEAFLHGFAANLVSAGVRLVPLGQTDGQRILAALETDVTAIAKEMLNAEPETSFASTPAIDLASMAHETLYTRLFRS